MKKSCVYCLLGLAALGLCRCTKPYTPVQVTTDYGYLVVEGVINAGSDSTFITLSRTVTLLAKTTIRPELKAVVTVQDEQNTSYPLTETSNGNYVSAGLNLNNSKKYRLSIKTTSGKTYVSDFTAVKNAPPIDSIGYTVTDAGITLYNNSHDATNSTRYYRYQYEETWKFNSVFESKYIATPLVPPIPGSSVTEILVPRTAAQDIHTCYAGDVSTSILLASTAKFTADTVNQNVIETIPSSSIKISLRYSILLKQYALTAEAYNYWALLKKNTEELGSIFDAQPTGLTGNIHNAADPNEPVIGYMSVGAVATKRVFIDRGSLPPSWFVPSDCKLDTVFYRNSKTMVNDVALYMFSKPTTYLAVDAIVFTGPNGPATLGFSCTAVPCADCTLTGVTKQPPFWK